MHSRPLLSILCMVYNHEPYLRQCLDGFVMQKTNFPFEAIVHDDASTDGSADIIREYAEKYPNIIKPIYERENQYSKPGGSVWKIMDAAAHPSAKYIAICEGDDYWIDPNKLQLQVDFLESHPDYSCSVHDFKAWCQIEKRYLNFRQVAFLKEERKDITLTLKDYATEGFFTKTLAAVYRKEAIDNSNFEKYDTKFDMALFYALMTQGKCLLINKVMGCYRLQPNSVTSSRYRKAFHNYNDIRLFSICKVEKTKESRDFVYNYLKPLSLSQLLSKRWNVIKGYYDYLGIIRGLILTFVEPAKLALGILYNKLKLKG